ncbi:MAG: hypothetical protein QOF76_2789 [Solirubrobacteraceae bacterium]|nr:hypothetical protein [Solirubrobacteraceae bacterium]
MTVNNPDHPFRVVSLHDPAGLGTRIAARPDLVRPRFAPIADLRRGGVAAYEVLLAFDGDRAASPRERAAELHAQAAGPLEAQLLAIALTERARLPSGALLAVNVSGAALRSPEVGAALTAAGSLENVVVVVTEDAADPVDDPLEAVRDAGGQIGLDETGSGYASLHRILVVRPEFVRIGARFVSGVDVDPAKAAVIEAISGLAARMDARVAADGISSRQELSAVRQLGVPYGQGRLFGPPPAVMGALTKRSADAIRSAAPALEPAQTVAGLIEARAPLAWASSLDEVADAFLVDPSTEVLVLVDERNRPLALAERSALLRGETYERPVMRITPTSPMRAVARRAAARPMLERFHPLVACDRRGVYLGLVRVEALLDALGQE